MELKLALRLLWRWWYLIIIPMAIATAFAIYEWVNRPLIQGGYATTIRYSAAQELNLPNRDGDYQDVWLASELTVNAFTDWIRSQSFRDELSRLLPAVDLSSLAIATDNERSVGVIYLNHNDAQALEQIADATFEVLQTRNQVYFPQLGEAPARVTLLDAPIIAPAPPPLTNRLAPFIRIGLAFFIGLGLVILADYLDPTLHYREELERQGISVIAIIPKYRDDKRMLR